MAMDHKEATRARTPQRRDPLLEYGLGCMAVILMWLAVSWAVVYLAPW